MKAGWYIYLTKLHNDWSESHYTYGPFWPKRKAEYYMYSLGRQHFVYWDIKFHWRNKNAATQSIQWK